MSECLDRLKFALADRRRVDRELGRGWMATVYSVEDPMPHRQEALQVLRQELAAAADRGRFNPPRSADGSR